MLTVFVLMSYEDRMAAARLNLDVLMVVCKFLVRMQDLLSISLTCSSLRPVAIRQLLLTFRIYLIGRDVARLEQFRSFLCADVSARALHVRTLNILLWLSPRVVGPSDIDPVSLIIDILASCPHVETISLILNDSSFVQDDNQAIIGAIASMQGLRSLSISGPRNDALTLAREVQSPLRKLAIHSGSIGHRTSSYFPHTLNDFLPRLALTLEQFEIGVFTVDPDEIRATEDIAVPPVINMSQYSFVRSLSIGSLLGKPLLDRLQHLFPALDGTLTIGELDSGALVQEEAYADIRTTNQRAQEGDGHGLHSHCAWTKLDRVICHQAHMLYLLGLRCPIRLLRIGTCSHGLHYATAALRENPIPRLTLSLLLGGGLQGLDELFSAELAGVLTHLTLHLLYIHDGSGKFMDRGVNTVARLPWSHFLVRTPV